ncbi:trehalose synthase complex regulatory subunit Tps3p [Diutina catenulata]
MTVIIASLFLPYTVKFEVEDAEVDTPSVEQAIPAPPAVSAPETAKPAPVLTTLGAAPPVPGQPAVATTPDVFFREATPKQSSGRAKSEAPIVSAEGVAPDRSIAGQKTRLIQPQSRAQRPLPPTVVETKGEAPLGMAQLKIRSSTNLAHLGRSPSQSNLSAGSLTPQMAPHPYSRPGVPPSGNKMFTLDNGSSTSIGGESDVDFEEDDTRMAPYGGFSNEKGVDNALAHRDSIFSSAPWQITEATKGNASLTKAVRTSLDEGVISDRRWVGLMAMPSDEVPKRVLSDIGKALEDKSCDVVWPDDDTFSGAYYSYCKQVLWPTLHYQIPDDPKSKAFEDHSWNYYQEVNQMVADKVVDSFIKANGEDYSSPDNAIWVHDYHLMLVPLMVRHRLPNAKIGFFLHVSFPSSEVFRCFAHRTEILTGMLGANCITFQSQEYVRHFLQTCNRLLLADVIYQGLSYDGKFIMTNTHPVGIDEKSLSKLVRSPAITEWCKLVQEKWGNKQIILSRDKMDKLRGIKQKFLAYERFLRQNPKKVESTVLIQILMDRTGDPTYEQEVMKIAARINSLSENISNTTPLVILRKDLAFEHYLSLLVEADLFIVSSMREGLNLTCHEFICATHEKHSPLMLSEFTGSASLLGCNGQGALLINPWDIGGFAETIEECLTMSEEEKSRRWNAQYDVVRTRNSSDWVRRCLEGINDSWTHDQQRQARHSTRFSRAIFTEHFNTEKFGTKLLMINIESPTVVPGQDVATSTTISDKTFTTDPSRMMAQLLPLLEDSTVQLFFHSYLTRSDLDLLFKRYPQLGIVAENGGFVKFPGSSNWVSLVGDHDRAWIDQCVQLIESKVERLPGSSCDVGECTVRFHPGKSLIDDKERAVDAMGDCIQHINEVFNEVDGLHASLIRNVVVVQNQQLTLRATEFLVNFYAQTFPVSELVKHYNVSGTHVDEVLSAHKLPKASFVLFTGGVSQIDEPIYEYLNDFKGIQNVATVATIDLTKEDRTSAAYMVSGKSELLADISAVEPST